jgi:hypothetical protein
MKKIPLILCVLLAGCMVTWEDLTKNPWEQNETSQNITETPPDTHSGFFVNVTKSVINSKNVQTCDPVSILVEGLIWNREGCPACIDQVVIGGDWIESGSEAECAYHGIPGRYPGESFENTVALEAPTTPGTYTIWWDFAMLYTCEDAKEWVLSRDHSSKIIGTIEVTGDEKDSCPGSEFFVNVTNFEVSPETIETCDSIEVSAIASLWNPKSCPACIDQVVIGGEWMTSSSEAECLYHGIPDTYPGISTLDTVTIKAPTTPGTYEIWWDYAMQYTCEDAKAGSISKNHSDNILGTIEISGETLTECPVTEHYVSVHRDEDPGWHCENVSGGEYDIIFRQKGSDYCRCHWTTVDYPGEGIGAEDCAPEEWGCENIEGTLSPGHCWNFATCEEEGGTLYRECACGGLSYPITVPEGTHELCAWTTVYLGNCPSGDCWTVEIE